jgi:hypothetical protein
MRPAPCIQFWDGEVKNIAGGLRLIRCGGHFAGATVLHWPEASGHKGALLSGDTIQVVPDRRLVEQANAVPEHVSRGRLNQKSALANRETRLHPKRSEPLLFRMTACFVLSPQFVERRPFLPIDSYVLALVGTNAAAIGQVRAFGILDAAGCTNRVHLPSVTLALLVVRP